MAVQIPDPGTGNGQTGDNEYVFRKKVKDNFSDQTNAASRLVGTASGNVMEVGAFGLGLASRTILSSDVGVKSGLVRLSDLNAFGFEASTEQTYGVQFVIKNSNGLVQYRTKNYEDRFDEWQTIYSTANTTKDPNGFLKGASPIAEIYSDKMDLNHDATQQGAITFEKLGVGDYLVKGSLGFAQDGWHIETPKDANGNVLVAVIEKQLANNDLSIKTYAKRFDDETGDIVPNLLKPRDIPTGRFISLRLHELPKEPPVMPTETQPEV